ncbi:MAG: hypothetical protein JSV20_03165 [Candidatus Bathyarchaeota archaeon]|nr:MAG: hypothetical protein JSV20_03165 [Candidatus Bathyarchaeota archaeon]
MASERPFKNRTEAKKEIRQCQWVGGICQIVSLGFGVLGAISDLLNITLGLESISWFLLAIVLGVSALIPHMNSVTANLMYGIETEEQTK